MSEARKGISASVNFNFRNTNENAFKLTKKQEKLI
jgi:hypothetical protein